MQNKLRRFTAPKYFGKIYFGALLGNLGWRGGSSAALIIRTFANRPVGMRQMKNSQDFPVSWGPWAVFLV
jgi:hypothetical protein